MMAGSLAASLGIVTMMRTRRSSGISPSDSFAFRFSKLEPRSKSAKVSSRSRPDHGLPARLVKHGENRVERGESVRFQAAKGTQPETAKIGLQCAQVMCRANSRSG